ncbi:MAG: BspA family leucine-rich repeat surface protein [Marinifilaceae bacterium]|jgi:surface protein|nr:BspA family leucine-rich repeat surface protein [Marinifilaceae bacterium]
MKKIFNYITIAVLLLVGIVGCTDDTDFKTNTPKHLEKRLFCNDTLDFGYLPFGVKGTLSAKIYNNTNFTVKEFVQSSDYKNLKVDEELYGLKINPINILKLDVSLIPDSEISKDEYLHLSLENSFGIPVNIVAKATTQYDPKKVKFVLQKSGVNVGHYQKDVEVDLDLKFINFNCFPVILKKEDIGFESNIGVELEMKDVEKKNTPLASEKIIIGVNKDLCIKVKVKTLKEGEHKVNAKFKFAEFEQEIIVPLDFKVDNDGYNPKSIDVKIKEIGDGHIIKPNEPFLKGKPFTVIAVAHRDSKFKHWITPNGEKTDKEITLTLDKSGTCTAVFEEIYLKQDPRGHIIATKHAMVGVEYELNGEKYTFVDLDRLKEAIEKTKLEGVKTDLSKYVTTGIQNMSGLFMNYKGLGEIDLSTWDTSSVSDMSFMFKDCEATITGTSNWDKSSVEYDEGFTEGASSVN